MNQDYVPMIDTSRWQFDPTNFVDWTKAAACGVKVNMLRVGNGNPGAPGATTDTGKDKYLGENIYFSLLAGLKVMTYWRVNHCASESGATQADRYCNLYEGFDLPRTAPLVMDVEAIAGVQIDTPGIQDWLWDFRARVIRRGHRVGVYSSKSFWDTTIKLTDWGDVDFISAHWIKDAANVRPTPLPKAEFWPGQAYSYQNGPALPVGWKDFAGWQFSDKGDGALLGSTVNTVDCNIIRKAVYDRWFPA